MKEKLKVRHFLYLTFFVYGYVEMKQPLLFYFAFCVIAEDAYDYRDNIYRFSDYSADCEIKNVVRQPQWGIY